MTRAAPPSWPFAASLRSIATWQHRHLTVDAEDFGHLGLELRIAFFQVIAHPRFREGRLLCGLTSCSARILETVPGRGAPGSKDGRGAGDHGHTRPTAGWSTVRANNPTPWPSGKPAPPARFSPR